MNIYSIQDQVAQYYMQPFYARNHEEAIRSFKNAVNDTRNPDNLLAKHPDNFALYSLGSFDETLGDINPTPPHFLGNGSNYINQ